MSRRVVRELRERIADLEMEREHLIVSRAKLIRQLFQREREYWEERYGRDTAAR